jgi:hypothetical protein
MDALCHPSRLAIFADDIPSSFQARIRAFSSNFSFPGVQTTFSRLHFPKLGKHIFLRLLTVPVAAVKAQLIDGKPPPPKKKKTSCIGIDRESQQNLNKTFRADAKNRQTFATNFWDLVFFFSGHTM